MKKFFLEIKIRFTHGGSAEADMTAWWNGTGEGLFELKKEIASSPQLTKNQAVAYVEIKAMYECFGEPVE